MEEGLKRDIEAIKRSLADADRQLNLAMLNLKHGRTELAADQIERAKLKLYCASS